MVIQQMVNSAMKICGLIAAGETPAAEDSEDVLDTLRDMINEWESQKLLIWLDVYDIITMTPGKSSYFWGTGLDITTDVPIRIINAFVRDSSNYDHPVKVITQQQYIDIPDKTLSGRPTTIYYNPGTSVAAGDVDEGILFPNPIDQDGESLVVYSMKRLSADKLEDLGDTLLLPSYYHKAIKYNLAVEIAPMFNKVLPQYVVSEAYESLNRLKILSASRNVEPTSFDFPFSRSTAYDINAG